MRAIQTQLLEIISKRLTDLTNIKFYPDDMSMLPANCLDFSDEPSWSSTSTKIRLEYRIPDINNIESAVITLAYPVKISEKSTLDDVYKILDALKTITNQELIVYLNYSEGSLKDKSFNSILTINEVGKDILLTEVVATTELIDKLYNAYKNNALSIICIRKLTEIDSKYKDYLISRGAINLKRDWWAIIDNN